MLLAARLRMNIGGPQDSFGDYLRTDAPASYSLSSVNYDEQNDVFIGLSSSYFYEGNSLNSMTSHNMGFNRPRFGVANDPINDRYLGSQYGNVLIVDKSTYSGSLLTGKFSVQPYNKNACVIGNEYVTPISSFHTPTSLIAFVETTGTYITEKAVTGLPDDEGTARTPIIKATINANGFLWLHYLYESGDTLEYLAEVSLDGAFTGRYFSKPNTGTDWLTFWINEEFWFVRSTGIEVYSGKIY